MQLAMTFDDRRLFGLQLSNVLPENAEALLSFVVRSHSFLPSRNFFLQSAVFAAEVLIKPFHLLET
ncbi:MAG TPA: hypothetical protein VE616_17555, partial [Candidatus Udaeobacter sp.]|nr:hypothetical protein [Candidatus Udaeobacter sp.]